MSDTYDGEAYCLKCRKTKPLTAAAVTQASTGTWMARGTCEVCGTKMSRILGKNYKSDQ